MNFPGGRDVGCIYPVKDSSTVVVVRQTWDPSAGPSNAEQESNRAAGEARAVPGDSDGATVKTGPPAEPPRVEVAYTRGNGKVRTAVIVRGGYFDAAAMEPRVVRLRRVP